MFRSISSIGLVAGTVLICLSSSLVAQVSIHNDITQPPPHTSAMLDVQGTDKGVLVPNVNIADLSTAAPVTAPADGLLVWNTNNTTGEGYYYWDGGAWVRLMSGNTTPLSGTGATNKVAFWNGANTLGQNTNLHWNNGTERLGVGNAAPQGRLDVTGDIWSTLSGDNALRIRPGLGSGNQYGFSDQHNNLMALVNEQGTTVQAMVLGDVNPDNASTLFGVSVATGGSNPTTGAEAGWQTRFEVAGDGTVRMPTYTTNGLVMTTGGTGTLALATGADLPSGSNDYVQNQTAADQTADFRINGNGLFNGGNVGIGTAGPTARLHVVGITGGDGTWNHGILVQNTNGTAGEPTVAFRNSSTGSNYWFTGLNQNAHYDLAYGTTFSDGNILVRLQNNGNMGIGTVSPTALLHLTSSQQYPINLVRTGNVGDVGIEFHDTDDNSQTGYLAFEHADGSSEGNGASFHFKTTESALGVIIDGAGGYYADTQVALRSNGNSFLTGGNLGIGTNGPAYLLDLLAASPGANAPMMRLRLNNGDVPIVLEQTSESSAWTFGLADGHVPNAQESFVISRGTDLTDPKFVVLPSGNVGIGVNNPTYQLHVNGRIRSNAINETSDARLKTDVTDLTDALTKVQVMRGVNYKWRTNEFPNMEFDSTLQFGLIAQELEMVVPELVHTDSEGWKSIEYSHIVPILIEAIKEQQEMLDFQQQEVEHLRGQEARLERLESVLEGLERNTLLGTEDGMRITTENIRK